LNAASSLPLTLGVSNNAGPFFSGEQLKGPAMSVKLIVTTIALAASMTSANAEMKWMYSPNEASYEEAMRQYGKELVAAKYAVKNCPEFVSYNDAYFKESPPNLWDADRFNKFMEGEMKETKTKLDKYQSKLGREGFCKSFVQFVYDNYRPGKYPIIISNK
jgi:hypothetical protein